MFRYADPTACPGCRAAIEYGALRCDACDLELGGWPGQRVFQLLSTVDATIAEMRVRQAELVPAGAAPKRPTTAGLPTAPPLPQRPARQSPGLSAASVPRILLSLGALCLVVAAVVFLAVAWAALGVEGRTGVLVVLTAGAAATAAFLAHRELRGGAEAFAAVALALVVLDVTGANAAGWLGDVTLSGLLLTIGSVLTVAALVAANAARSTPIRELAVAELAAGLGALVAGTGLAISEELSTEWSVVLAMVGTAALTTIPRAGELKIATGCLATVAAIWWCALVMLGVYRIDEPNLDAVWLDFDAWPLLVAGATAALMAAVRSIDLPLRAVLASVAVALATLVIGFPVIDESATRISLAQLAIVGAAAAISLSLPRPWRWVTAAPALVAGLGLAASALRLLTVAAEALLEFSTWGEDLKAAPFTEELAWSWPLLLPAGAVGAAVAGWVLTRCATEQPVSALRWWVAALALFTVPLVPTLYGAPLWAELLILTAAAIGGAALTAYTRRVELVFATGALAVIAFFACFADEWSSAIALGLTAIAGLVGVLRGRDAVADASGMVFLPAMGGFLWTVQHLADIDPVMRAIPIILVAGLFAIARPSQAGELPAGVVITFAIAASVVTPTGWEQGWLAAYLTLTGALVAASALIHGDRRELGWVSGALFTAAQWLRLEQLGVETVEAYTLPLAIALLVVGLVSLRRPEQTTSRALSAGLGLALVPTLLQVLVDPVSDRALILGGACLLLILVGVRLRWSAPLVAGAAVGTLIVLREGVHAQLLPQWMVIGAVGVLLTALGVTWEQRLAEIRRAAGYLRALR